MQRISSAVFKEVALALSALAFFCLSLSLSPAVADRYRDDQGMLSWPQEEMVQAMELYVPRRLAELDVPGAAIAVVRDGQLVYEGTFGLADTWNGAPVTKKTLFEAASLGKSVSAYGVLILAREGFLPLDAPLQKALPRPWPMEGGDVSALTVRQLLTHTSGLGNNTAAPDSELAFAPGRKFSYSGIGYMYLQHAVEEIAAADFQTVMRDLVFAPFGMEESYFALPPASLGALARGYVPVLQPVLIILLPFLALSLIFIGAGWALYRFALDRPKYYWTDALPPAGLAFVTAVALVWPYIGTGRMPFILIVTIAYLAALAVLYFIVSFLAGVLGFYGPRDGTLSRGDEGSGRFVSAVSFLIAIGLSVALLSQHIPVPRMPAGELNAANSLRSTAGDLGRFVAGFIQARRLGTEWRERMVSETVPVRDGMEWGLGIGMREAEGRKTYWQWGANPGFASLMVIDPARRGGVVILTNSSDGDKLAQEVAGQVLGLQPGWELPAAAVPF